MPRMTEEHQSLQYRINIGSTPAAQAKGRTMLSYYPERLEERYLLAGVPTLVADLNTDGLGSSPAGFTVFNNAVYFSAYDDQHGRELWRFDGYDAMRLTDIDPGL